MESKEAQNAEVPAVAAQAMDDKETAEHDIRMAQQYREEISRQAQQSTMWASIKSKVHAASDSAILGAHQIFGEPKAESTVKQESADKDESQ